MSTINMRMEEDNNNTNASFDAQNAVVVTPHLTNTNPCLSLSASLPHQTVFEVRISDDSHSHAKPSQRKKGGCKAFTLSLASLLSTTPLSIAAKCDVRKSFSNSSFAKYYARGQYAVVPVDADGTIVMVVEEAKKGRDGKWFVSMEKGCVAPYDDTMPVIGRRHPLLAFAAEALYRITILTNTSTAYVLSVQGMFEHGGAMIEQVGNNTAMPMTVPSPFNITVTPPASATIPSRVNQKRGRDTDEDEEDEIYDGPRQKARSNSMVSVKSEASFTSTSTSPAPPLSPDSAYLSDDTDYDDNSYSPYSYSPSNASDSTHFDADHAAEDKLFISFTQAAEFSEVDLQLMDDYVLLSPGLLPVQQQPDEMQETASNLQSPHLSYVCVSPVAWTQPMPFVPVLNTPYHQPTVFQFNEVPEFHLS